MNWNQQHWILLRILGKIVQTLLICKAISQFPLICTLDHILSFLLWCLFLIIVLFYKNDVNLCFSTGSSILFQTCPLKGTSTLTRTYHSVTTVLSLCLPSYYGPCLLLLLILLAHLRIGLCSFHSLYIHNFPQWPLLAKKYFSKSLSSLTPLGQHDAHSLQMTLPWLCDPAFSGFFLCLPGSPFSIPLLTLCLILPLICWYASALHPSAFFPLYTCLFLETCLFSRLHWPLFAADLEIISPALTCYLV